MTAPAASKRDHPPGTCRQRQAEGLCRACAAAFLGGSTSWFDDGPRLELPCVRGGAKLTWLIEDLRTWQRAHREVPPSPAIPQARDHGPVRTLPSSGSEPRSTDAAGRRQRASRVAEIEKRLTEKRLRYISRNAARAAPEASVVQFPGKSPPPSR